MLASFLPAVESREKHGTRALVLRVVSDESQTLVDEKVLDTHSIARIEQKRAVNGQQTRD